MRSKNKETVRKNNTQSSYSTKQDPSDEVLFEKYNLGQGVLC